MGISRIVSTDFWEDGLVNDSFSPEDKYFMLYLMTNPHSRQAGIYKLNKKIAAFELGYSVESVSALLDRFENKYHRIIYSTKEQEIAVLNAPKYNIVKGGKPVLDCIGKDLSGVKDKSLIVRMYRHLKPYFEASEKPSVKQVGEVWKKASDTYKEVTPVNEIDNDNDNDRIVDVSCDESSHESSEGEPASGATLMERFEIFYKAYPKHKSRGDAEKAWKSIKPDDALLAKIMKALEIAKKDPNWQKEKGQYVPYPASWLRAKGWEDEPDGNSDDSASHTDSKKGWGGYLC